MKIKLVLFAFLLAYA